MIEIVQYTIQLRYYSKEQKQVQDILLEKKEKQNLTLVKSFRIISLLNYISKILEKIIVEQLSQLLENFLKLHLGQIGVWKKRYTINIKALLVYEV